MILRRGGGRLAEHGFRLHTFCPVRVTIPGKNCRTVPFHRGRALSFQIEDLSKTETGVERLILQSMSPGFLPMGAKHVRTSRG